MVAFQHNESYTDSHFYQILETGHVNIFYFRFRLENQTMLAFSTIDEHEDEDSVIFGSLD